MSWVKCCRNPDAIWHLLPAAATAGGDSYKRNRGRKPSLHPVLSPQSHNLFLLIYLLVARCSSLIIGSSLLITRCSSLVARPYTTP